MRYILLTLAAFLLIAAPAFAANDTTGEVDVQLTINDIMDFDITNTSAITLTLSEVWTTGWQGFDSDVAWSMECNEDWDCSVDIDDGTTEDWDNSWLLRIGGSSGTEFDEDDGTVLFLEECETHSGTGSWDLEIYLTWPTGPVSGACTLDFTASAE